MQAHTKKHPIETIEIRFIGPIVNIARAIESLKPLGFVDTSDSVPWREAYPEYSDEDLPGLCLRGSRYREGLTQKQLADTDRNPAAAYLHDGERQTTHRQGNGEAPGESLSISYKVFL